MKNVKADLSAKYLAALDLARARGDVRYYLEGIYIEPIKGGGVFMVATNGHMMIIAKDDESYASRPFILRTRKELITACKFNARKRAHADDTVTRVIITGGFAYAMKHWYEKDEQRNVKKPAIKDPMLAHAAFPFDEIEGKFPDWRRVIPDLEKADVYEEKAPQIYFNPEYVDTIRKAFHIAAGGPEMGLSFSFSHPQKSIAIRPYHFDIKDSLFAVLMPMHGDFSARQDWIIKEKGKSDDK